MQKKYKEQYNINFVNILSEKYKISKYNDIKEIMDFLNYIFSEYKSYEFNVLGPIIGENKQLYFKDLFNGIHKQKLLKHIDLITHHWIKDNYGTRIRQDMKDILSNLIKEIKINIHSEINTINIIDSSIYCGIYQNQFIILKKKTKYCNLYHR